MKEIEDGGMPYDVALPREMNDELSDMIFPQIGPAHEDKGGDDSDILLPPLLD